MNIRKPNTPNTPEIAEIAETPKTSKAPDLLMMCASTIKTYLTKINPKKDTSSKNPLMRFIKTTTLFPGGSGREGRERAIKFFVKLYNNYSGQEFDQTILNQFLEQEKLLKRDEQKKFQLAEMNDSYKILTWLTTSAVAQCDCPCKLESNKKFAAELFNDLFNFEKDSQFGSSRQLRFLLIKTLYAHCYEKTAKQVEEMLNHECRKHVTSIPGRPGVSVDVNEFIFQFLKGELKTFFNLAQENQNRLGSKS